MTRTETKRLTIKNLDAEDRQLGARHRAAT